MDSFESEAEELEDWVIIKESSKASKKKPKTKPSSSSSKHLTDPEKRIVEFEGDAILNLPDKILLLVLHHSNPNPIALFRITSMVCKRFFSLAMNIPLRVNFRKSMKLSIFFCRVISLSVCIPVGHETIKRIGSSFGNSLLQLTITELNTSNEKPLNSDSLVSLSSLNNLLYLHIAWKPGPTITQKSFTFLSSLKKLRSLSLEIYEKDRESKRKTEGFCGSIFKPQTLPLIPYSIPSSDKHRHIPHECFSCPYDAIEGIFDLNFDSIENSKILISHDHLIANQSNHNVVTAMIPSQSPLNSPSPSTSQQNYSKVNSNLNSLQTSPTPTIEDNTLINNNESNQDVLDYPQFPKNQLGGQQQQDRTFQIEEGISRFSLPHKAASADIINHHQHHNDISIKQENISSSNPKMSGNGQDSLLDSSLEFCDPTVDPITSKISPLTLSTPSYRSNVGYQMVSSPTPWQVQKSNESPSSQVQKQQPSLYNQQPPRHNQSSSSPLIEATTLLSSSSSPPPNPSSKLIATRSSSPSSSQVQVKEALTINSQGIAQPTPVPILKHLGSLPNLTELRLSNCRDFGPLFLLAPLFRIARLTIYGSPSHLMIDGSSIEESSKHFLSLATLKGLRQLRLAWVPACLPKLSLLTHLDLSKSPNLNDMVLFEFSKSLVHLRSLLLDGRASHGKITDEGVLHLASLPSLAQLDLSHNPLISHLPFESPMIRWPLTDLRLNACSRLECLNPFFKFSKTLNHLHLTHCPQLSYEHICEAIQYFPLLCTFLVSPPPPPGASILLSNAQFEKTVLYDSPHNTINHDGSNNINNTTTIHSTNNTTFTNNNNIHGNNFNLVSSDLPSSFSHPSVSTSYLTSSSSSSYQFTPSMDSISAILDRSLSSFPVNLVRLIGPLKLTSLKNLAHLQNLQHIYFIQQGDSSVSSSSGGVANSSSNHHSLAPPSDPHQSTTTSSSSSSSPPPPLKISNDLVAPLSKLVSLKSIVFSDIPLSAIILNALAPLPSLVYLRSNKVDETTSTYKAIANLSNLRVLILKVSSKAADRLMAYVVRLKNLTHYSDGLVKPAQASSWVSRRRLYIDWHPQAIKPDKNSCILQ